jgi:hypothetical protein
MDSDADRARVEVATVIGYMSISIGESLKLESITKLIYSFTDRLY